MSGTMGWALNEQPDRLFPVEDIGCFEPRRCGVHQEVWVVFRQILGRAGVEVFLTEEAAREFARGDVERNGSRCMVQRKTIR